MTSSSSLRSLNLRRYVLWLVAQVLLAAFTVLALPALPALATGSGQAALNSPAQSVKGGTGPLSIAVAALKEAASVEVEVEEDLSGDDVSEKSFALLRSVESLETKGDEASRLAAPRRAHFHIAQPLLGLPPCRGPPQA